MPSELAFRAQLVIREQREVYDYWRRVAGHRPMPARSDINPAAIAHLLPGISIIDVGEGVEDLTYRLAGTRLREIYGMEITGRSVFGLGFGDKRHYWRTAFHKVIVEGTPMQGAVKGPVVGRSHVVLFWLRLPLSDDGVHVNKILCYDVGLPATFAQQHRAGALLAADGTAGENGKRG